MLFTATLAGFATGAGLIIAIGAQNAFVLRQGLQCCHVGLVVAVCIIGDIVLIICGVAGMGALVREWPELLQVLCFGGAAFLGVYSLMAAQRAWHGSSGLTPTTGSEANQGRVLLACLAFTFLNPHVYDGSGRQPVHALPRHGAMGVWNGRLYCQCTLVLTAWLRLPFTTPGIP